MNRFHIESLTIDSESIGKISETVYKTKFFLFMMFILTTSFSVIFGAIYYINNNMIYKDDANKLFTVLVVSELILMFGLHVDLCIMCKLISILVQRNKEYYGKILSYIKLLMFKVSSLNIVMLIYTTILAPQYLDYYYNDVWNSNMINYIFLFALSWYPISSIILFVYIKCKYPSNEAISLN